jgi:ATP-dependent DNA ligase
MIFSSAESGFNALQHSRSRAYLQFYVFDILIHRGHSVLGLPLEARRELLDEVLSKVDYPVLRSTPFDVALLFYKLENDSRIGHPGKTARR